MLFDRQVVHERGPRVVRQAHGQCRLAALFAVNQERLRKVGKGKIRVKNVYGEYYCPCFTFYLKIPTWDDTLSEWTKRQLVMAMVAMQLGLYTPA